MRLKTMKKQLIPTLSAHVLLCLFSVYSPGTAGNTEGDDLQWNL